MTLRNTAWMPVAVAAFLTAAATCWSQQGITADLRPSGVVQINRDGVFLAMIELNAHGPEWTHAPQETASAQIRDLPDRPGKHVSGTLTIPKTDEGTIQYDETVEVLSQGLWIEYSLTMKKAMVLNGLQFSINLPVTQYIGKEVLIPQLNDDTKIVGLPKEERQGNFQIWSGQGAKVEVAKGTKEALTLELRGATDVIIQDLRQWDNPVFEIRLPAIMENSGRSVAEGDRFHLDVIIIFAEPIQLRAL